MMPKPSQVARDNQKRVLSKQWARANRCVSSSHPGLVENTAVLNGLATDVQYNRLNGGDGIFEE